MHQICNGTGQYFGCCLNASQDIQTETFRLDRDWRKQNRSNSKGEISARVNLMMTGLFVYEI